LDTIHQISRKHVTKIRTVILYGSLLAFGVNTIYSATLISTILQPVYPIKAFGDLLAQGFTFYSVPVFEDVFFGNVSSGVILKRDKKLAPGLDSYNRSYSKMMSEEKHAQLNLELDALAGFVYYKISLGIQVISESDICERISFVRFLAPTSNLFIAGTFYIQKNSPLRPYFNRK
jgi:hypothetical protein